MVTRDADGAPAHPTTRPTNDAGIVRHRAKVEATILNARATLEAQRRHGSLAALVWSFEPSRRGRRVPRRLGDLPTTTPDSVALSKELRRLGFRYVGPTTAYAAMESLGLVNDHLAGCHVRSACDAERRALTGPQLPGTVPLQLGTASPQQPPSEPSSA